MGVIARDSIVVFIILIKCTLKQNGCGQKVNELGSIK